MGGIQDGNSHQKSDTQVWHKEERFVWTHGFRRRIHNGGVGTGAHSKSRKLRDHRNITITGRKYLEHTENS